MKSIPITQNRVSANVAHNIRILLEHRKMSQTDLAEKSRVGKMQISRYVNERTRCNVDDAMNIAEALDIDFALFVSTKMSHKDVAVFHRRRNSNFPVDYRRGITSCN